MCVCVRVLFSLFAAWCNKMMQGETSLVLLLKVWRMCERLLSHPSPPRAGPQSSVSLQGAILAQQCDCLLGLTHRLHGKRIKQNLCVGLKANHKSWATTAMASCTQTKKPPKLWGSSWPPWPRGLARIKCVQKMSKWINVGGQYCENNKNYCDGDMSAVYPENMEGKKGRNKSFSKWMGGNFVLFSLFPWRHPGPCHGS